MSSTMTRPGYLNQKDYLSSEIENHIRVNLNMWKEVMQATSTGFAKHIVPILIDSIDYSIKVLVIGGHAIWRQFICMIYTKEIAIEERIISFSSQ
jgi:hypothetical protein